MPKECWAKARGDCGRGISREHYVSQGIFDQESIYVQGFEWCKDSEIKISLNRLASKILCGVHNNGLSEVDKGGIVAVRHFEEILGVNEIPPQSYPAPIDGHLFERWLLKTALNVSFGGAQHIGVGMVGSKPGWPSPYLLAVVFGDLPFTHKMGAYFMYPVGEYKIRRGEISVVPVHKNGEIGGFHFHLRGLDVFLSLYPGHAPPRLGEIGVTELPKHVLEANMQYRSKSIIITTNGMQPATVRFTW